MADYGFTMRFSTDSNERSWTETFYKQFSNTAGDEAIQTNLTQIAGVRANCLVRGNRIVDCTYFLVDDPSTRVLFGLSLPGQLGLGLAAGPLQDVAPVSILVQLSSAGRRRQYLQRGVLDLDIIGGEFEPAALRLAAYRLWLQLILGQTPVTDALRLRTTVFQPPLNITGVISSGATLELVPGAPIPAKTKFAVRTRVAGGGPRIGTRVITTGVSAGQKLPFDWANGDCLGGTVRQFSYTTAPIVAAVVRRAARTRRTGGPFTKFRGSR